MRSRWLRDCSVPTSRSATSSCSPVRSRRASRRLRVRYVELLAEDGQLAIADIGGDTGDATFAELAMTADFPQVGAEARAAYTRTTGRTVDGVIALDPQVLAALLWYAGPIQLTTFDQQLDPYNAAPFLLHDQYLAVGGPDRPVDAVGEVGLLVVDACWRDRCPIPPRWRVTSVRSPPTGGC